MDLAVRNVGTAAVAVVAIGLLTWAFHTEETTIHPPVPPPDPEPPTLQSHREPELSFLERAQEAVQGSDPRLRGIEIEKIVALWAIHDLDAATAWLNNQYSTPEFDRAIRRIAISISGRSDHEIAIGWAESIRQKEMREAVIAELYASAIAEQGEPHISNLLRSGISEDLIDGALTGDVLH